MLSKINILSRWLGLVRNKQNLMRFILFSTPCTLKLKNGLTLKLEPDMKGRYYSFFDLLVKLNKMDLHFSVKGGGGVAHLDLNPTEEKIFPINDFDITELRNLIILVYRANKYGFICTTKSEKLDKYKRVLDLSGIFKDKILVLYDGTRFRLGDIDSGTLFETYFYKTHDFGTVKDKIILDVGAQAGDTAIYFAKRGATVYAIEPVKDNFNAMKRNLELNKDIKKKIIIAKVAIGIDGEVRLSASSAGITGDATAEPRGVWNAGLAKSYTISSFCKKYKINHIDYLKMDIKGNEFHLCEDDLNLVRDRVKIEYFADMHDVKDLLGLLTNAGFSCRITQHNPEAEEGFKLAGTINGVRL